MNIYQKKVIKEKEYIFNEDFVQTKSTYTTSKHEIDSDAHSNLNIKQLSGMKVNQDNKRNNNDNSRFPRSKSQFIEDKEKYFPNQIKTVLIQFKTPIKQLSNENEQKNKIKELNYKTFYTEKFYNKNNISPYNHIKKENTKFIDMSLDRNNYYNNNLISPYMPYYQDKFTRNKSAILKNDFFSNNDSMNNSSNTLLYKKSFCLDKHKNYGGNFKNKERSKTNPRIKPIKSSNNINYKKNNIMKNISFSKIQKIMNESNLENTIYRKVSPKVYEIKSYLFQQPKININSYKNLNSYINIGNRCKIENNNLQSNSSITQDENNKDMITEKKTEKADENNIHLNFDKREQETSNNKNKNKMKNIQKFNFKKNIHNFLNINDNDNINSNKNNFSEQKQLNKRTSTSQTNINKYKNNNSSIVKEPNNDVNSMKNNSKNKGNLLNLINYSEQITKRNNIKNLWKNSELDKINSYMNKNENNKIIKMKKNSQINNYMNNNNAVNNNKKLNNSKAKNKSKGKIFRTNSAKNIECENSKYEIKSIPLKLFRNNQNKNNKYISGYNNINYNIQDKNKIAANVIFINKKDFSLWNDLTRIYDHNGKFQ